MHKKILTRAEQQTNDNLKNKIEKYTERKPSKCSLRFFLYAHRYSITFRQILCIVHVLSSFIFLKKSLWIFFLCILQKKTCLESVKCLFSFKICNLNKVHLWFFLTIYRLHLSVAFEIKVSTAEGKRFQRKTHKLHQS